MDSIFYMTKKILADHLPRSLSRSFSRGAQVFGLDPVCILDERSLPPRFLASPIVSKLLHLMKKVTNKSPPPTSFIDTKDAPVSVSSGR